MLEKFNSILKIFYYIEIGLGGALLLAIVGLNCLNLFLRWFYLPIDWVLEISLFLFVYSTFLIIPVLLYKNEFITMKLIDGFIGEKFNKIVSIFSEVMVLIFFIYIFPLALKLSLSQANVFSRGLNYPRIFLSIVVPIIALLCIPVSLFKIIKQFKKEDE